MSLGARVRFLRTQFKMSLKELSQASGLSASKLSRIENGRSRTFDADSLRRLARALGVSAGHLVGEIPELHSESAEFVDSMAGRILRGYRKLSPESREKLKDFLCYLEASEARKRSQA